MIFELYNSAEFSKCDKWNNGNGFSLLLFFQALGNVSLPVQEVNLVYEEFNPPKKCPNQKQLIELRDPN